MKIHDIRKNHHTEKGFRNNYISGGAKSFIDVLKWGISRKAPKPFQFETIKPNLTFLESNKTDSTLTWIGHSTFLIQHEGFNLITDPHFSERSSPVSFAGPKRYIKPTMTVSELPAIDIVLISHDHYDHLDKQSVIDIYNRQKDNPPLFMVPLKVKIRLEKWGIKNIVELDWWESQHHSGWNLTCVPAQHFSGRSMTDRNSTLWAGWVAELNGFKIFFAGDTGYSPDFNDIYQRLGSMDLSLIPIGAYEPRWFMKDVHTNPDDAVLIHEDLHSQYSVGMHWGTFILTDEPVDTPPKRLAEVLSERNLATDSFESFKHGETRLINFLSEKSKSAEIN
jgi:N-acyl-phosphatidylethanolamine-hydrolysing phospholipase D